VAGFILYAALINAEIIDSDQEDLSIGDKFGTAFISSCLTITYNLIPLTKDPLYSTSYQQEFERNPYIILPLHSWVNLH